MSINRAFIYGDLLFETIAVRNNHICYCNMHYQRLTDSANHLGFELPEQWNIDYFTQIIQTQITMPNQRVRFVMHRNAPGFYYPQNNIVKCVVDVMPLPSTISSIKKIDIYEKEFKACTPLSNLKTGNALVYVMAAQYAQQHGFDEVFITNQHGRIAEATSSNVFVLINNTLYTPPLSEAPVDGIIRKVIMQHQNSLIVVEKSITIEDLLDAEECFLTNSIQGIVSIERFRQKQYSKATTRYLQQELSVIN